MKLPKTFENNTSRFRLTRLYLQELMWSGSKVVVRRSVKRSQIREFFLGTRDRLDGRYPGESWDQDLWYITRDNAGFGLYIGCVYFQAPQAKIIETWALQKPRKVKK